LANATSKAAVKFAAGSALAAVSSTILALADGALQPMFVSKPKYFAVAVVLLGLLGSGAGAWWIKSAFGQPVAAAENEKPAPAKADPYKPEDPRIEEIRKKLAQRVRLDKGIDANTPLEDAIEWLGKTYDLKFTIDSKAFTAAGLPNIKERPVQLAKMVDLKLSRVLQFLLADVETNACAVRYRIQPDGVAIVPITEEELVKQGEPERDPPEKALEQKLSQVVNLDKGIDGGTPLKDALEFLSDRYDLTLLIDNKAFAGIGVPKVEECPVQLPPTVGMKMETVLHMLLRQIRGEVAETTGTFVLEDRHVLIVPAYQAGAISADGKLAGSVTDDRRRSSIRVRDVANGQELFRMTMTDPPMTVGSFGFSPDGKRLVATYFSHQGREKGFVCLWDTTSGKKLRQWSGRWAGRLLYSPDGKILACETIEGLTLVDATTGAQLAQSAWQHGSLCPLGFTAGSKTLVTAPRISESPATVLILDVATGKGLSRFPIEEPGQAGAPADPLQPLALSPEGRFLIAQARSSKLSLWEIATGGRLDYFQAEGQLAVFSPDGRFLATKSMTDQKVQLWDVRTGKELQGFPESKQPITTLAFSPDGKAILAGRAGDPPLRMDVGVDRRQPSLEPLAAMELESLWNALSDQDTSKARSALLRLAESPDQTLPFLQSRLKPVTVDDVRLIPQWITDLDSDRFAVRQKAMAELERLVELTEHDLRRLLAGKPSFEMQQRMEKLLEICKGPVRSPVRLQIIRGIEVLEYCQKPEARQLLKKLAEGAADVLTTREAAAAQERVAQRLAYLKTGFSHVQPALPVDVAVMPKPHHAEPMAQVASDPPVDRFAQMPLPRGIDRRKAEVLVRGLAWLARHQAEDGHWGLNDFYKHGKCNCGNPGSSHEVAGTAFALLPFLRAGATHQNTDKDQLYPKTVERALRWLITRQGADGGFSANGYEHALATICLCEAYGLTEDAILKGPAQRAINCCVAWQHAAGGFRYGPRMAGDMSVSGWFVQALHSGNMAGLNVPKATWIGVNNFLDSVGIPEGSGYGYMQPQPAPTMTATGLLCRQMMGWEPKRVGLQKGLEYLRKLPPSPNFRNSYYYYYATQVVHNLAPSNPEAWEQWYPKMRDMLIDSQDQGGNADRRHQKGSWSPEGDAWGAQLGRLGFTSLALLTLEVPDQWLPLAQMPPKDLQVKEIDNLWADLARSNNFRATWSARALASSPKAVAFLQGRLHPAPTADGQITARWIADLGSERFETRLQAEEELQKLGESAAPALLKVRDSKPSLEVAQRVERLLGRLKDLPVSEEHLQATRAIRVLEHIGTLEARKVLEILADGAQGARLTQMAQAALNRLTRQDAP
jgi:hypothetical protein